MPCLPSPKGRPANRGISAYALSSSSNSWPCAGSGNRQTVADIGQIIFEIAIFFSLRLERYAANLAVAGGETPADRTHASPFGAVDRQRIQYAERGREHLGAHPLSGVLHVAGD